MSMGPLIEIFTFSTFLSISIRSIETLSTPSTPLMLLDNSKIEGSIGLSTSRTIFCTVTLVMLLYSLIKNINCLENRGTFILLGKSLIMKNILVVFMILGFLIAGCSQGTSQETEAATPSAPASEEEPVQTPETIPFTSPGIPPEQEEPLPLGPGPVIPEKPQASPEPSQVCIDAENGKVTYNGEDYSDSCLSHNVVYEYYCENDVLKQKQVMCAGTDVCNDGVCVEGEEHECTESGGHKNPYVKGSVTYWSGGEEYVETDKCYDDSSVLEVWCEEDATLGIGILECDNGDDCQAGECHDE